VSALSSPPAANNPPADNGTRTSSSFSRFARTASAAAGQPYAFMLAVSVVALWALTGPMFGFGATWQLVINTGTTIVTFLMVFLVQNTQNRDAEAMQLKLNELIHALEGADDSILDVEESDQEELDRTRDSYKSLARGARQTR